MEAERASSAIRRAILQGTAGARRGSPVAPAGVQKCKASSASERRGFGGRRTRAIGRLGLPLVFTERQGSLQGLTLWGASRIHSTLWGARQQG